MARINVEERWWSDPRRTELMLRIGYEADSAALNLWRLAQEFYSKQKILVPLEVFQKLRHSELLLEVGLAVVRDRSVYVRGSSDLLGWLSERREQASEAGKKSAKARREKLGSAQPKGAKSPKTPERNPNETRTKVNDAEPSYSSSSSSSNSSTGSAEKKNPPDSKPRTFVAAYCDRWKRRWGFHPDIRGKDAGIAKRLAKDLSLEKFELYLDAFFQMPDAMLVKRKHPLGDFEIKLPEISVFAQSGKFTSTREAHQADESVALATQLQKIREGAI